MSILKIILELLNLFIKSKTDNELLIFFFLDPIINFLKKNTFFFKIKKGNMKNCL